MTKEHEVYLGLGSNLGCREENLRRAVALVEERVGPVLRKSSVVESEPWGFTSENMFLNCVIRCVTELTPRELLKTVKQIEKALGRIPTTAQIQTASLQEPEANSPAPKACSPSSAVCSQQPVVIVPQRQYADRPIDIDILLYDDLTVDEPDLKIPHPLMWERDFVMIPLRELMGNQE